MGNGVVLLFLALIIVCTCAKNNKDLGKDVCKRHSCHPLTKCHALKIKKDGKWTLEAVCMKVPSCATKKCDSGERCWMKPIRCQLQPCFDVPTCLPDINEASPEYQIPPALLRE